MKFTSLHRSGLHHAMLGLACLAAGLSTTTLRAADAVKGEDLQRIVEQIRLGGVRGEVRVNVNGQVVVLNGDGIQVTPKPPADTPALQGPALATLRWRNGETLAGALAGVKDGMLRWWSPLFVEPLALDLGVLQDVEFAPSTHQTEELISVRLRDGGRISGTLISLDADTLTLRSGRHGSVTLKLSEVVTVQRTRGEGLLYHGPDTAGGWHSTTPDTKQPEWRMQQGGTFGTLSWNRATRLDLELPEKVEVLLRLRTSNFPPEFTLTLTAKDGAPLTLENWSNTVVLAQGTRFAPLGEIAGKASFSVRLFWDRKNGRALAFTPEGEPLGELKPKAPGSAKTVDAKERGNFFPRRFSDGNIKTATAGTVAITASTGSLQLRNNGRHLTLEELRVRTWSGELPKRMKATEPHVELTSGKVFAGKGARLSQGRLTLASGEVVPLEKLDALITGVAPVPAMEKQPPASLIFDDGTRLVGTLLSVQDGLVSVQTSASAKPVTAPVTGLQRMHLAVPSASGAPEETPFGRLDRLVLGKFELHGKVIGTNATQPRWLPVGAKSPVEVVTGKDVAFVRWLSPEASPAAALKEFHQMMEKLGASSGAKPATVSLLYLENGDVLPAVLHAMDAAALRVSSPVASVKELPAAQVRAVQFGGREIELTGFSDSGWRQIRGAPAAMQRDAKKATFKQAAALAHPNILQGDELKISLSTDQGWGAMRMRLFTTGGDEPQGGIPFLFYLSGSELYAGEEIEGGGEFKNQVQIKTTYNKPVALRIALREKQVEIFANGISICKASLTPAAKADDAAADLRAQRRMVIGGGRGMGGNLANTGPREALGQGLVIETASVWGNGEQSMSVSDFSVRPNPMRPWMPAVDAKAKEQTLTLPRFRSDDPPTHVLVALNGDVLRGRLEAATTESLRVMSGLEALTIPRDRVAAVIRLQPPDKISAPSGSEAEKPKPPPTPPAAPSSATHRLLLRDGGRLALNVERFEEARVIGTSSLLGRCEVPWDRVHTVRLSAPEPTTAQTSYQGWKLKPAPKPVLPEDGGQSSPLLGQAVKDFKVPMLTGGDFDFAKQRGKVVILDFWATWCGPCIQSLPELMDTVESLKGDKAIAEKFVFIAMNEAEPAAQVKRFLEQRKWSLPVALDLLQSVGRQFQVEGIPHTVVIGPDGKIAWQNTGHRPGAAKELAEMVRKLATAKSVQ